MPTVQDLRQLCRNKGISGYSKLNKSQLIVLLEKNKVDINTPPTYNSPVPSSPAVVCLTCKTTNSTYSCSVTKCNKPTVHPASITTSTPSSPVAKPKVISHQDEQNARDKLFEFLIKTKDFFPAGLNFGDYMSRFKAYNYMLHMVSSARYNLEDFLQYDVEEDIASSADYFLSVTDLSQHLYATHGKSFHHQDNNYGKIQGLLTKYTQAWYFVLAQRLYRNYVDETYEVIEDLKEFTDSYPNIQFFE